MRPAIDDGELEQHVRQLQGQYPNSGNEIIRALLRTQGVFVTRSRVREMLTRVNPTAAARRWSRTVARRVYHVPYPNSLWHIDGNMRLIRWGFVTHGAIDGYSRLITYLSCSTDNRSTTVLSQFLKATCLYALPSRHFYLMFYSLEDSEVLNPDNDVHRLSLHIVYLPEIQNRLEQFRQAWNLHPLRTENNRTPTQLWTEGMLRNIATDSTAVNNVFGENPYSDQNIEAILAQYGIQTLPTLHEEEFPAGKLPSFLDLAGQTLQSFVQSGEDVSTPGPLDQTSTKHQFVLALAGIITNVAAVPCGRDFLSSSGHGLLGTLMQLLEPRKPGALPRLKVLMLMALYNVSISVRGLKYISQSPGLLPMVWTLLEDQDPDVCLHSLRLLQSLLLEEEVETTMGAALLTSPCLEHVCRLTSSQQPALKQTACDTLEDIQALFCKLGKPDRQSSFQHRETKTPVRTLP
ncbi:unnamed protein product [Arctogadus glacialis]